MEVQNRRAAHAHRGTNTDSSLISRLSHQNHVSIVTGGGGAVSIIVAGASQISMDSSSNASVAASKRAHGASAVMPTPRCNWDLSGGGVMLWTTTTTLLAVLGMVETTATVDSPRRPGAMELAGECARSLSLQEGRSLEDLIVDMLP
jgi:hypothetical protein